MIRLLDRQLIKEYSFSSYSIGSLQQAFVQGVFENAESDSKIKEVLDKYDFIAAYSSHYNHEFVCSKILHINISDMNTYLKVFADRFEALLKMIETNKVIVALNVKCDWFKQRNNYRPVKLAMNELQKLAGNKQYYGAFEVDTEDIQKITGILFWLCRCNASLPHIHIIDEKNKISFNICKYGNLHAEIYSPETEKKMCIASSAAEFSFIETETEFLATKLRGRAIIL